MEPRMLGKCSTRELQTQPQQLLLFSPVLGLRAVGCLQRREQYEREGHSTEPCPGEGQIRVRNQLWSVPSVPHEQVRDNARSLKNGEGACAYRQAMFSVFYFNCRNSQSEYLGGSRGQGRVYPRLALNSLCSLMLLLLLTLHPQY